MRIRVKRYDKVSYIGICLPKIGASSARESSLLSSASPVKPSPSRSLSSHTPARSTGSLDRLREENKAKTSPPKLGLSSRPQSFIPRRTSTPKRSGTYRHSMHLSSLPEISTTPPARPNRWSIGDLTHGFAEAGLSLPNSPSDSEGSDLQFSMDSLLESGTESEGWVRVRLFALSSLSHHNGDQHGIFPIHDLTVIRVTADDHRSR